MFIKFEWYWKRRQWRTPGTTFTNSFQAQQVSVWDCSISTCMHTRFLTKYSLHGVPCENFSCTCKTGNKTFVDNRRHFMRFHWYPVDWMRTMPTRSLSHAPQGVVPCAFYDAQMPNWLLVNFRPQVSRDYHLPRDICASYIVFWHLEMCPGALDIGAWAGNGNLLANGIFKDSFVHFVFKGAIDIKSAFRKWLIRLLCCKLGWVNNMANKWGGVYISFNWISKKIVAISSIFSVANVYDNCMHSSSIPLYNKASTIFVVINLDSLKPQSWKKPTLSSFVACTGCCNSGDKWLRNNS